MVDTIKLGDGLPMTAGEVFQQRLSAEGRIANTPLLDLMREDRPGEYGFLEQTFYRSPQKDTVIGTIGEGLGSLIGSAGLISNDVDPNFDPLSLIDDDYLNTHPWMIAPYEEGRIDDIPNMHRFMYFEARQREDFEIRDRLGQGGIGKSIVTAIPTQIVEAFAGGLALKGLGLGGRVAQLDELVRTGKMSQRIAVATGTGAAANVVQEQLLESLNPDRNVDHRQALMWAAGMGVAFGAAVPPILRGLSAGGNSVLKISNKRLQRIQSEVAESFDAREGAMGAATPREAAGKVDPNVQASGANIADLDPDGTIGKLESQHVQRLQEIANGARKPEIGDGVTMRSVGLEDTTIHVKVLRTPKTAPLIARLTKQYGDDINFLRHEDQQTYNMLVADGRVLQMENQTMPARMGIARNAIAEVSSGRALPGRFRVPARSIVRNTSGVVRRTARILFDIVERTADEQVDPGNAARRISAEQYRNQYAHQRNEFIQKSHAARKSIDEPIEYTFESGETATFTKRSGNDSFGRAVVDYMRRANRDGTPPEAPKQIAETAAAFRDYMTSMGLDLRDVGMLNATADELFHVPRRWLRDKIAQNVADFKERLLNNWNEKRANTELEDRPLINSVIDTVAGLRKLISDSFKGNGIDDVNPHGALEQPFSQKSIREAIDARAPGITESTDKGAIGGGRQKPVDHVIQEQAEATGDDYLALLGEQYKRRSNRDYDERFTGLNTARLREGDEFKIGDENARVTRVTDDEVTIQVGDEWVELPGGGGEFANPNLRAYRVPKDKKIPARKNTLKQQRPDNELEEIMLRQGRAKQNNPELLSEADLHDIAFGAGKHDEIITQYEAAYQKWLDTQAENTVNTLTGRDQTHGGVEHAMTGGGNPLKNRTLDIDEDQFADYLDDNLFQIADAYHRHVSGRLAGRRAVKDNIDELEPIVNDLLGTSLRTGRRLGDYGEINDPYNPQLLIDAAAREYDLLNRRAGVAGDTELSDRVRAAQSAALDPEKGMLTRKLAELENRTSSEMVTGWRLFAERQIPRVTFMASLGKMTVSALTDVAAMSFAAGLNPQRWGMVLKSMNLLREVPRTGLEYFHVALSDSMQNLRMMELAEITDIDPSSAAQFGVGKTGRALAQTDRVVDAAARQFSKMTLMQRWNTNKKRTAATFIQQDIIKNARRMAKLGEKLDGRRLDFNNLSKEDRGILRSVGISQSNAERMGRLGFGYAESQRLVAMVDKHGRDWKGEKSVTSAHRGFINPIMGLWSDREIAERLIAAVDGEVLNIIVEPKLMSRPVANEKLMGRLINQFQSFAFSYGNQLVPMAMMRPAHEIAAFMSMATVMGIIADTIHNALSGRRSIDESLKQWEEKPLGMIYAGVDRSGLTSWLSRPLGMLEQTPYGPGKLLGNERLSSMYGRPSATGLQLAGPAFGWAENLALKGLIPLMSEHRANPRTHRALWNAMPYHNLWAVELLLRMAEKMGYETPQFTGPLGR